MSPETPSRALTDAVRDVDTKIERIAERLVREGVPLWDALDQAREQYRRGQRGSGHISRPGWG